MDWRVYVKIIYCLARPTRSVVHLSILNFICQRRSHWAIGFRSI